MKTLGSTVPRTGPVFVPAACVHAGSTRVTGVRTGGMRECRGPPQRTHDVDRSASRGTHNTQHTTHNTQHTTHNTQHTTHNTQHTTHNTQHTPHATQNTKHTTHTEHTQQTHTHTTDTTHTTTATTTNTTTTTATTTNTTTTTTTATATATATPTTHNPQPTTHNPDRFGDRFFELLFTETSCGRPFVLNTPLVRAPPKAAERATPPCILEVCTDERHNGPGRVIAPDLTGSEGGQGRGEKYVTHYTAEFRTTPPPLPPPGGKHRVPQDERR